MSVYGHRYHDYSNGYDPETSFQIERYVRRTEIIQPVCSTSVDQYKPVPLSAAKKTWYGPPTGPDYNRELEASPPHSPKHGPLATTIPGKTHGPSGGRHGIGHADSYHDNGHGGDYNYKNKKGSYQPNAYAPWNDNYGDKHRQNEKPTRSPWGSPSDSSLSSKPNNHMGSHFKPANNIGAPVDYYDNKGHQYGDDMEPSAISPGKQARPTRPMLGATSDSSIRSKPTKHVGPLSKPTNHTGAHAEYYGDKHSNKYDSSRQPSPINTRKQARPTHPPWDSSAPSKPKNTFGSLSKPTNETSAPEEYRRVYAKPTSAPTSPSARPIVPASTWRKPDTSSETIDSNEAARRYRYNNRDVQSLPPEDDTGSIDSTEAAKRYGGVIFRG